MNDPATLPSPDAPKRVGHETSDVSPSYVGLFALGLALMIALVLPVLGWMFGRFEGSAEVLLCLDWMAGGHLGETELSFGPWGVGERIRLLKQRQSAIG